MKNAGLFVIVVGILGSGMAFGGVVEDAGKDAAKSTVEEEGIAQGWPRHSPQAEVVAVRDVRCRPWVPVPPYLITAVRPDVRMRDVTKMMLAAAFLMTRCGVQADTTNR